MVELYMYTDFIIKPVLCGEWRDVKGSFEMNVYSSCLSLPTAWGGVSYLDPSPA